MSRNLVKNFLIKITLVMMMSVLSFNAFSQLNIQYAASAEKDKKIIALLYQTFLKSAPPQDSLSLPSALRNSLTEMYESGYLAARVDSITQKDSITVAWWYAGDIYKLVSLKTNPADEGLLSEAGVREKLYRNKPFSPSSYAKLCSSILKWSANNGYPFALVRLDSVKVQESKIIAKLLIDKGPLIVIDTAEIRGNAKLSKVYLLNYLSIKPGSLYNETLIKRIGTRMKELPFVAETRTYEIEFLPGLARPVFYLQQKKASQFNGIIGLQPDNITGKTYITGDVQLRLHNAFGKAELFDLRWSNPQPRTQDLKVNLSYPFLFNAPVGIDANLGLYKKDSIYLEFERQAGFRYYLSGNNSVKVFAARKTSNLISTKGYEFVTELPAFADVSANTFGFGFNFEKLDYRLNPRNGYSIEGTIGAGIRKIKKNAKVNQVVYDSLNLKTNQYNGGFKGDIYFPLAARSVINFGTITAFLESPSIFENELYRIGGLKSLRGFDEGSLLASRYIIGKAEYRFILEQNSYLLLFYNLAYYENHSKDRFFSDAPYGFGAGITFETKLGIISFNYALGSQQDNPILFKSAKIHFGLVNYF